jgi:hypothetical protein
MATWRVWFAGCGMERVKAKSWAKAERVRKRRRTAVRRTIGGG